MCRIKYVCFCTLFLFLPPSKVDYNLGDILTQGHLRSYGVSKGNWMSPKVKDHPERPIDKDWHRRMSSIRGCRVLGSKWSLLGIGAKVIDPWPEKVGSNLFLQNMRNAYRTGCAKYGRAPGHRCFAIFENLWGAVAAPPPLRTGEG